MTLSPPAAHRSTRRPAPPPSISPRPDLRGAALVALGVLAATALVNHPFLLTYAVRGDDFALLLHSARFFEPSAGEWVTTGFGGYFANFPEATEEYTRFLRPTVNLTIWLESWLARSPNSPVFLLTNYVGHALCAALVYLLAQWMVVVPRRVAIVTAALFAGSLSALEVFHSPAFRGDMLGALFGLAALLGVHAATVDRGQVDGRQPHPSTRWIALAAVSLLLAVFAKETAIAAPGIAAAWWLVRARGRGIDRRRTISVALLLIAPMVVYAVAKTALQGGGGAYASLGGVHRNVAQALTSAFVPGGGALELRALGTVDGWELARRIVAVALNGSGWLLLIGFYALAPRPLDRRVTALALAALAALAVPMLLAPYARLMYFGQAFALPLFALLAWYSARFLVYAGLLASPAWLLASVLAMQPGLAAANRASADLQRVLAAELRDPSVRRVYLVNDVTGVYGSLAQLRMAAARAGRSDVALRVAGSMGRSFTDRAAAGEPVRFTLGGDALRIETRCRDACDFSFPGVLPENQSRLGVPGVIRYERVEPRHLVVAVPDVSRGDWRVIGFDPSGPPRPRVLRPGAAAWR